MKMAGSELASPLTYRNLFSEQPNPPSIGETSFPRSGQVQANRIGSLPGPIRMFRVKGANGYWFSAGLRSGRCWVGVSFFFVYYRGFSRKITGFFAGPLGFQVDEGFARDSVIDWPCRRDIMLEKLERVVDFSRINSFAPLPKTNALKTHKLVAQKRFTSIFV